MRESYEEMRIMFMMKSLSYRLMNHLVCFSPRVKWLLALSFVGIAVQESGYGADAPPLTLSHRGKTEYCILISPGAGEVTRGAGKEMAENLGKATQAVFPIVTGSPVAGRKEIRLEREGFKGEGDGAAVDPEMQGFRILTDGEDIVIRSRSGIGLFYGVNSFLEEEVGFRWYAPDVTRIPSHESLSIPAFDRKYVPKLAYRELYSKDIFHDRHWALRMKINSGLFRWPDKVSDHPFTFMPGYSCHTFAKLVPPEKWFESHPKFYGLNEGKRDKNLLCLSNPKVFEVALKTLKGDLAKYKERPIIVSISQNDCGGWCRCDNCLRITQEEGVETGLIMRFLNKFDDAMKKAGEEGVIIHTLAYVDSDIPPVKTVPNPGIIIQLCPIAICYGHSPGHCSQSGKDQNIAFEKKMRGWAAIHNNLWMWSYHVNFAHSFQPFPNIHTLADYIRYFVDNHAKGIFSQCDGRNEYAPLAKLKNYLLAKLMWNPSLDEHALIREFVDQYYKEASGEIMAYLAALEKTVKDNKDAHTFIFHSPDVGFLSDAWILESEEIFKKALAEVEKNEVVYARVKAEKLSIDYMILERWRTGSIRRSPQEVLTMVDDFDQWCRKLNIVGITEHDGSDQGRKNWIKLLREKAMAEKAKEMAIR